MTDRLCVTYDLAASILEPAVEGYEFSVWPNAYPGNGSQESQPIAAAFGTV